MTSASIAPTLSTEITDPADPVGEFSRPHRRVLMLCYHFPPRQSGGVERSRQFARFLPEHGWEPTVLTLRQPGEPRQERLDAQGGIVLRTPQLSPGGLRRWFRYLFGRHEERAAGAATTFAPVGGSKALARDLMERVLFPDPEISWALPAVRAGARAIRDRRIELLYSSSPPESAHVLALWLRRLTGLPWVMDLRDSWSFQSLKKPLCNSALRRGLEATLESSCFEAATRVIVSSAQTAAVYSELHPRHAYKISVIPNGVDLDELEVARTQALRSDLPTPWTPASRGELLFAHAGTLCRKGWNDVDLRAVFEAMGRVEAFAGGCARLVLAGRVSDRVKERARECGVASVVEFPGPISHVDALRLFLGADRLLLYDPLGDGGTYVHGKLYEYLACERPIVGVLPRGASRSLLEEYGHTLNAPPHDVDEIREVLARATDTTGEALRVEPFDSARFDRRVLTSELDRVLTSALSVDCIAACGP